MDDKTYIRQTGQARGKLRRLEQDLRWSKVSLAGVARNRIVGGAILLIGVLALIRYLTGGSGFVGFIAAAGLLIGGWMLIKAQMKIGETRRSITTITDSVTGARTNLTELEAQSPSTE